MFYPATVFAATLGAGRSVTEEMEYGMKYDKAHVRVRGKFLHLRASAPGGTVPHTRFPSSIVEHEHVCEALPKKLDHTNPFVGVLLP